MRARRILTGLYFCNAVLLALLLIYPIRGGLIRLLIIASAAGLIVGSSIWLKRSWAKYLLPGVIGLFLCAITLVPSKHVDVLQLRSEYVQALRRYNGTPYTWGGENLRGIDCSGILRAAWIDSQFRVGIRTGNARLIRGAFFTWWHDSSASDLSQGASGHTRPLHSQKSIRANEDRGLLPGDFAIVANGVHALAFLGEQGWIEADPAVGKVIVLQTTGNSPWLDSSAVFVRWKMLE